ncbi:MAG TPA: glycoside hydrolase family 28 protein [Verrucomicrobiae bacterium]|nr:glycoside hydrolase family 28 protein [Verrucomicrobiae bacterium]
MIKPALAAALFCSALTAFAQPHTSPVFNILDYGAKPDGKTSSTAAIRAAIQDCAKAGGGTVWIPGGNYVTGAIEMVSNMTLHVDSGAVVHFVADRSGYPTIDHSRYEGVETRAPAANIGGYKLENIAIEGHGTITASNEDWVKLSGAEQAGASAWRNILNLLQTKSPIAADLRAASEKFFRTDFIRPVESKNVRIEGIHIVGSPMWTIHPLYCENVVIHDVIVETFPGRNTDGVDIDSCHHVRISDSYFDTGDDAICLKSGKDADGLRVNRPTDDVAITNCTVHRGHGAVVLGSETSGGIRNVVASNIVSVGTDRGIRIKSTRGRGGLEENIRFDNWVIEDSRYAAIEVTNYYTREPEEPVSERTPVFRNFGISHVTIKNCPLAADIQGLPEMPVQGLNLTDVVANTKEGLRAFNTVGMELHNVRIDAENGAPFLIRDSKQVDLDGVQTRGPKAGIPVVRLDRVEGVTLRNSIAWPGTDIFLSIAPGQKSRVTLLGDEFANAKRATLEEEADLWKAINSPDRKKQ